MDIKDFIEKIEEEFDDIEKGTLKPDSKFREHFEWNSINALIFIALVDAEYEVTINAEDFNKSETIQDLFNRICEKKNNQ
jgi:acyl carrier protein